MTTIDCETSLRQRAAHHLAQTHLVVDYYRIRRKLAYDLPLRAPQLPDLQIPGVPVYPWGLWLAWAMEERILSLGWCAQLWGDSACLQAAWRDLEALAGWPLFRQYDFPDLGMAHFARLLSHALLHWTWLQAHQRQTLRAALTRLVADGLPRHFDHYGTGLTVDEILAGPDPDRRLHNVTLIGSLGVALAAHAIATDGKEAAVSSELTNNLKALIAALLALRENGHSEGVSYDGYVLDFICDWASTLPQNERRSLFLDGRWDRYLVEFMELGAPGAPLNIAPIGDVEPEAMPFQASSQIKLARLREPESPLREAQTWYLQQFESQSLRTDALAVVASRNAGHPDFKTSRTGALPPPQSGQTAGSNAQYAHVLRTGWSATDVSVAISAANCPLAHLPASYGSLCIGTQGHWFIGTPGYQQYMPSSEREWTNGPTSRNTPLVNGHGTTLKRGQSNCGPKAQFVAEAASQSLICEISHCYAETADVNQVTRKVSLDRLAATITVRVEDQIGNLTGEVQYYWHGHTEASWWIEAGRARLYLAGRTLWIWSPQYQLQWSDLQRLRGSRGPLALAVTIAPENWSEAGGVTWFFSLATDRPEALTPYEA